MGHGLAHPALRLRWGPGGQAHSCGARVPWMADSRATVRPSPGSSRQSLPDGISTTAGRVCGEDRSAHHQSTTGLHKPTVKHPEAVHLSRADPQAIQNHSAVALDVATKVGLFGSGSRHSDHPTPATSPILPVRRCENRSHQLVFLRASSNGNADAVDHRQRGISKRSSRTDSPDGEVMPGWPPFSEVHTSA